MGCNDFFFIQNCLQNIENKYFCIFSTSKSVVILSYQTLFLIVVVNFFPPQAEKLSAVGKNVV
jgi:hypothetical protein